MVKRWSTCGQSVVKMWSNGGPTVKLTRARWRSWPSTAPPPRMMGAASWRSWPASAWPSHGSAVRYWSNHAQILVKPCADTTQIMRGLCSDKGRTLAEGGGGRHRCRRPGPKRWSRPGRWSNKRVGGQTNLSFCINHLTILTIISTIAYSA
jgi:hypothetical protein